MYCNNHMLCLGDCPKTFKSLTYNPLHMKTYETDNASLIAVDVQAYPAPVTPPRARAPPPPYTPIPC